MNSRQLALGVQDLIEKSVTSHIQALWSLDDYPIEIKHCDLYYNKVKFTDKTQDEAYRESLFHFEETFFKEIAVKIRQTLSARSTHFTSALKSLLYNIIESGHGLLHFTQTANKSFKINNIPLLDYQYLEDSNGNITRVLIKEIITHGHSRGVRYKLYCQDDTPTFKNYNEPKTTWYASSNWDENPMIDNKSWILYTYESYIDSETSLNELKTYEPERLSYNPIYLYIAPKKQTIYVENKCVAYGKVLELLPKFKHIHNILSALSGYSEKQLSPDIIRDGAASFENKTSVSRFNNVLSPWFNYRDRYNASSESVNYNKGTLIITPREGLGVHEAQQYFLNPGNPSSAMELIQLLLNDITSILDPNSSVEGRTSGARMTNDEFNARSGMDYVQYIYEVSEISGAILTPLMHTLVNFFMKLYKKNNHTAESYFSQAKELGVDLKNIVVLFNQQQTNSIKGAKYNEIQSVLQLAQASLGLELQTQGLFKSSPIFDRIKALSGYDLKKSNQEQQEEQMEQQLMQQQQQQTGGMI